MRSALSTLMYTRRHLPRPLRHAIRWASDPLLSPVGSLAGARSPTGRRVALTFDDGPDPVSTPLVLAALAQQQVQATFFMLSGRAVRHPDIVREVLRAGHEVALHGPDHRRLTSLSAQETVHCLRESKYRLEEVAGQPVRWFRPPFGSQTLATFRATRDAGLVSVVWTTEGEDWVCQPPEQIASRVLETLRPGGVVLLHDAIAGDPRDPPPDDPLRDLRGEIATAVVDKLRLAHLQPTALGDLLASGRARHTAWFRP